MSLLHKIKEKIANGSIDINGFDKQKLERISTIQCFNTINKLENTLTKSAGKLTDEQKTFYQNILNMLYQAMQYEDILKNCIDKIHRLRFDQKYLLDRNQFLENELNKYTTIEELTINQSLDEYAKAIRTRLQFITDTKENKA